MRSKMTSRVCNARVMEMLEGRTHMSVTLSTSSSVSGWDGYSLFAEADLGDDLWETSPSLNIGTTSYSDGAWGEAGWYVADDGSFDSGPTGITVTADSSSSDGGLSMAVGGAATVTMATGSRTYSQVKIQAAACYAGEQATWSNVVVDFYRNGRVAEEYTVGKLEANTFDEPSGTSQEAVAVVSASGGACTKVVVSGTLRLQAQSGTYPLPGEVFGNILVN